MNAPAVEFYQERGVDLTREPLEIALCAQHNNGGLAVDRWWRTNVEGLFAAGEAAGTHGVCRPGGSALNAGQVGSTRAAQYIAARGTGAADAALFDRLLPQALEEAEALVREALTGEDTLTGLWAAATERMSRLGGPIRSREGLLQALAALEEMPPAKIGRPGQLPKLFRLEDILLSQRVYLSAMLDYLDQGGRSRGSALYTDPAGQRPHPDLPPELAFTLDDGSRSALVQEGGLAEGKISFRWRPVRPIPEEDDFFENVWRGWRENQNID